MTFGIAAGVGQCLQAFSRLLPGWLGRDWRGLLNAALQGLGTVISAQQILRLADLVEWPGLTWPCRTGSAVEDGSEANRRSFAGSEFLPGSTAILRTMGIVE